MIQICIFRHPKANFQIYSTYQINYAKKLVLRRENIKNMSFS